ncbi:VTC domain-containing protein [Gammaproteobacteria bacterium]|nr:VTC domain-containing protein [Gammaproteobacteria bacterium]
MSFRIEEKIPVSFLEGSELIQRLRGEGLKNLFPKRTVVSDYFDNQKYDLYRDSEEGLLPRKKVRIRHYPDDGNKFLFEKKISSLEGRYKTSSSLDQLSKELINSNGYLDNDYGLLQPVVQISYIREYYVYESIRLTMDSEIMYQDINCASNSFAEDEGVIELKAHAGTSIDFLISLIQERRRRFSKYCNAVRYLNLS